MRGDLAQLRVLLGVADCGSFTGAAAQRNIEVSGVSRAVRELEIELGVVLFERLPRGVRLTDAGESLVASSRDILERYERAGIEARQANVGRSGHLAVGFLWSSTSGPLVELLRNFAAGHPRVVVELTEDGNDELLSRLRSERLDVALAATDAPPLPRLKQIGLLSSLPLWLEPLTVVIPVSVAATSLSWEDLAGCRLLCRSVDDARRFIRYVERLGGPTLAFERQAVSQESLLGLVAAGLGCALFPASLTHLLPPGVQSIPISSPGAVLQVEAVWRAKNENPALTLFLALCRKLY